MAEVKKDERPPLRVYSLEIVDNRVYTATCEARSEEEAIARTLDLHRRGGTKIDTDRCEERVEVKAVQ